MVFGGEVAAASVTGGKAILVQRSRTRGKDADDHVLGVNLVSASTSLFGLTDGTPFHRPNILELH